MEDKENWKSKIAQIVVSKLKGLKVTEAHNVSHLRNVAELTQLIGDYYGFSHREKELAFAAGWFHDFVRSPTGFPVGDEEVSARESRRILKEAGLITEEEEEEAIVYAIEKHGHYPEWWERDERERFPETLEEKLHFVLFVADKIEQNGAIVIARRCSFAAGDRLRSRKGDLRNFGFQPDRDEALVVAVASIYRLTFINPEEIYPSRLQPVVRPLYEVQREFVLGIFRALNLKVEDIAHLLLERKDDKGRNILQAMKIEETPTSVTELTALITLRSKITDEKIASVSDDLASSSLETVDYFSHRYQEDLKQLVINWRPQGKKAKEWQKLMSDYEEGGGLHKPSLHID